MYLYKKNDKSITVYSFVPNKEELIKLKKRYLEDIKSVILHINDNDTKELLFSSPTIMFYALDRKETNGKITYMEEEKNDKKISRYINGEFDSLDPLCIIGDTVNKKSSYSGELYNCDSTLLFTGGHYYNNEFITNNGILLTGYLADFQSLLSNNISNVIFSDAFGYLDEKNINFLKIFSCTKERIIKLDDLKFMQENGLIQINDSLQDIFEKSEEVLNSYNKVKKLIQKM